MNKFILFVVCLIGGVSVTGFSEILVALSISPVNTIATQSGIALVPFAIGWLIAKLFSFFIKKISFFTVWVFCSVAIIAIMFLGSSSKDKEPSYYPSNKVSIYRKLSNGVLMQWSGDKECFVNMNIDLSNSAIPVSLSKTNERKTELFKELTQENFVIAVFYYDRSLSDEAVTKFITKDIFLKIKSMCQ